MADGQEWYGHNTKGTVLLKVIVTMSRSVCNYFFTIKLCVYVLCGQFSGCKFGGQD